MELIKKSLRNILLTVLIACAVISMINKVMDYGVLVIYKLWFNADVSDSMNFLDYMALLDASSWHNVVYKILTALIFSPLYMGVYKYCFLRLKGENPKIGVIFDFYRNLKNFFGSVIANNLYTVIQSVIYELHSVSGDDNGVSVIVSLILPAAMIAAAIFLWMTQYNYAYESEQGCIAAIKNSIIYSAGNRFKIFGAALLSFVINLILTLSSRIMIISVLSFIPSALVMWIGVTLAFSVLNTARTEKNEPQYEIVGTEYDDSEATDFEKPFIEPYDFFIEADNRFSDSKTVMTENIRGINAVELLESMELSDEVKNHSGVRRKLKRLFDDLAFEIGEYVTYEGGRTVSGSVIEEIDERELEIAAEISKNSDSEPFKAVISIKEN